MEQDIHDKERWDLLQTLRSTVEDLLASRLPNVWSFYGGLNRLHNIIERIFKHGCRIFDYVGEPDCWMFIQGLNYLQPSLATSPPKRNPMYANVPKRIISHKYSFWLYISIQEHSLSQTLSFLLSDKEHLLSCYEPWAFLCQEKLAEGTIICLKAVEMNQPALLTQISPTLYIENCKSSDTRKKAHRRSSSYPIHLSTTKNEHFIVKNNSIQSNSDEVDARKLYNKNFSTSSTWNSLVELKENLDNKSESAVDEISEISPNVQLADILKVDYSEEKVSDFSPVSTLKKFKKKVKANTNLIKECKNGSSDTLVCTEPIQNQESHFTLPENTVQITEPLQIGNESQKKKYSFLTSSAPEFSGSWRTEVEGQKDTRLPKKSFIEDDGSSVLPMATGYFPKPKKGQSLTSFLSSAQFTRANAELDRENAHFSISEAMIAAMELLKCNRDFNLLDEVVEESDEEINNLKLRIRIRRQQKEHEKRKLGAWNQNLLSDGRTDTTTTDQSISPSSISPGTSSDSIVTDDEDLILTSRKKLSQFLNSKLSVSMSSSESEDLFSSEKIGTESALTDSITSAEGVALSLISKFSEKHLPRASDLKWLVSEEDAPQMLLPLPKSWPVYCDDKESDDKTVAIPLRGTNEWAPPRSQIIFTPHPRPIQKILIAKQNYLCAGCGMKVAVEYANRFRYCEYLGRYFCTGCHTNQVAVIPGRILFRWDFNRYPVSNFSYRLLDKMALDALFPVADVNPILYRRVKQLQKMRILRSQLNILKGFLFQCRFATKVQDVLEKLPNYLTSESDLYSIQDFIQIKSGVLPNELSKLVRECCKHVAECVLCQGRGFICELCNSKEIIFRWELNKVKRCDKCGNLYHLSCIDDLQKFQCKKCNRLKAKEETEKCSKS